MRLTRVNAGLQQNCIPGYSSSYVSRVESGDRPGGREFWQAAASRFGVSEEWLRTGTDSAVLELADAQRAVYVGSPSGVSALRDLVERRDVAEATRDQARTSLIDALMSQGRYLSSIPLLREQLPHSVNDPLRQCGQRMRLARCLSESGDLHAAVDVCQPMLTVIEELQLQQTVPAIQLKVTLAGVLLLRGDLISAQGLLEETALDAAVEGSDDALASVLWNAAHLARERGDNATAEQLAHRSSRLFDRAGNLRRYATTLVVWADIALDTHSPDLSAIEQRLLRGMELIAPFGDAVEIGYAYHDLGRLRAAQGRHQDAAMAMDQAMASLGPDHPLESARCLITRASLDLAAGDRGSAHRHAKQAHDLLKSIPANFRARRLWTALAEAYSSVGDLEAAVLCYQHATVPHRATAQPYAPAVAL